MKFLLVSLLFSFSVFAQSANLENRAKWLMKRDKCTSIESCKQLVQEIQDQQNEISTENKLFESYNKKTLDPDPKE